MLDISKWREGKKKWEIKKYKIEILLCPPFFLPLLLLPSFCGGEIFLIPKFLWQQLLQNFESKDHMPTLNENRRKNIPPKFLSGGKSICADKHLEKFWRFLQPHSKSICGRSLPLCHYYELTPITRHSIKEISKQNYFTKKSKKFQYRNPPKK